MTLTNITTVYDNTTDINNCNIDIITPLITIIPCGLSFL